MVRSSTVELAADSGQTDRYEYRYERKFVCPQPVLVDALVKVHPAGFSRIHPTRWINNVYLDTWNLGSYHDNAAGVATRQKFRIRWYGADVREAVDAVLERKMKAGHVGVKQRVPLGAMPAETLLAASGVRRALATARAGFALQSQLDSLVPVLLNRYHRDYFASCDGRLRLTVDRRQRFAAFRRAGNGAPPIWRHLDEVVLELKYAVGDDELAAHATQAFPFRVARHSKYVCGVDMITSS